MLKKRGVRSQVSVEFLLVVGFAFLLISGTTYYFLVFINSTEESIAISQSTKAGESIVNVVKDAVASNGYYKKTIHLNIPDGIGSMKNERGSLVMNVTTSAGDSDVMLNSDILFGTKIVSDEIQGGVFTIEKLDDVVIVCTGTSCSCDPSEDTFALCTDGMDNDCNGYADREDCACAEFSGAVDSNLDLDYDDDFDGYIDIYCDGKLPDCEDNNNLVYPNAPPFCDYDYNVDFSCLGLKSDDADCGIIECDGLDNYYITGVQGPTTTSFCSYDGYTDISTNRCEGLNDCKDPNSADCGAPITTTPNTAGICKYISDCIGIIPGFVSDYAVGTDTGLCRECDGSGAEQMSADDAGCGTIDCDGLDVYYITGVQGPTTTSFCKHDNYADLLANRCEGLSDCKDDNTADCGAPTTTTPNTAGICQYISNCVGVAPGFVSNYALGTDSGLCRECNGAGAEQMSADDAGCGTVDCDGLDVYYITGVQGPTTTSFCNFNNYADLAVNRCEGLSDCKDANTVDCGAPVTTTPNTAGICKYISNCVGVAPGFVSNYGVGTDTGLCRECNGAGAEQMSADDAGCGIVDCDGLDNYYITGVQGPTTTSFCNYANYADLAANRCEGLSDCKDANTADCGAPAITTPNTAGVCQYISNCVGAAPGFVSNYVLGTSCGAGLYCNGFGACNAITYSWNVGGWSGCSAGCGPGVLSRTVECRRDYDWALVADAFCLAAKPATTTPCNLGACCTPASTVITAGGVTCDSYCIGLGQTCSGNFHVNTGSTGYIWSGAYGCNVNRLGSCGARAGPAAGGCPVNRDRCVSVSITCNCACP